MALTFVLLTSKFVPRYTWHVRPLCQFTVSFDLYLSTLAKTHRQAEDRHRDTDPEWIRTPVISSLCRRHTGSKTGADFYVVFFVPITKVAGQSSWRRFRPWIFIILLANESKRENQSQYYCLFRSRTFLQSTSNRSQKSESKSEPKFVVVDLCRAFRKSVPIFYPVCHQHYRGGGRS